VGLVLDWSGCLRKCMLFYPHMYAQGKQAKLAAGSSAAKPSAVVEPAVVAAKSTEEVVAELFTEMGRAISPSSTSALMDMLKLGGWRAGGMWWWWRWITHRPGGCGFVCAGSRMGVCGSAAGRASVGTPHVHMSCLCC
jgi:hypothetical protein